MAKIIGVDFSAIGKYRDAVTVRMPDGAEIELPLIKVRDVSQAMLFLQRNDVLASKYAVDMKRLKSTAHDINELLKDSAKALSTDSDYNVIDGAYATVEGVQKHLNNLHVESHALCDEIHTFIEPYLKDTGIIQQLKELDDSYTILVLQYMLNGAVTPEDEDAKDADPENPTIAQ